MSYMLLIVEPQGQRRERSDEEGRAVYQRMVDYGADLTRRGLLAASNSLKSEGVRLRKSDGRAQLFDGPFSESKEFVGGFFLLNCETRAQALALAGECPAAEWATIEVREVGPCYE
jgi:hypothetical protein